MNKIKILLSNGETVKIEIARPELIYGATALMLKSKKDKGIYAINPVTKEKLQIIDGSQEKIIVPLHNEDDYKIALKYKLPFKLAIMPYFTGEREDAPRANKPTVRRHSVVAIIKNVDTDEYLCEEARIGDCRSFVQGGIEEGETIEQAALREIKEETGYIDVSIKYIYNISVINHFFAAYKGKNATNRFSKLEIVFGNLNSDKHIDITDEEKKKQKVIWVKKEKLKDFINLNHNRFALDILLNDTKVFEGEGIMSTNDENNEKKSVDVRQIIIDKYCEE